MDRANTSLGAQSSVLKLCKSWLQKLLILSVEPNAAKHQANIFFTELE